MTFGYGLEKFNGLAITIEKRPISICIKAAERILNGNLVLVEGLDEIPYDINSVDWEIKDVRLNDSCQLALQSLLPIQYCCIAFETEHLNEYIEHSVKLFHSWYKYEKRHQETKSNPYVWNDYAVCDRTCTIIYCLLLCKEYEIHNPYVEEMVEMLVRSAEWLFDDKNYFLNCNHGIMEDQTLIYLSKLLLDKRSREWLSHAKKRLQGQIEFCFTNEMVHVENSPQYQETVLRILSKTAEFLDKFEDDYGRELYESVKHSFEFMYWMIKPYGGLADIGDSDGNYKEPPYENKRMQIFRDERLNYAAMLGHMGTKPEELYAYYQNSGYFISRSSWEKDNLLNATWFMFKSGYKTRVHKHADDLSFMLVSKGHDIFIDSGKYGYKLGDPYVDYLHSALGHNTVIVNNRSYSISNERTYMAGLCEHRHLEKNGHYVRGYNNAYEGVSIQREIFQWENCVVLHDMVDAVKEECISQLFHLPNDLYVIENTEQEVLFRIADSGWNVRIRQLDKVLGCNLYDGMQKDKTFAYVSPIINSIVSSKTLKFDKCIKKGEFVTVITLEPSDGSLSHNDYSLEGRTLKGLDCFVQLSDMRTWKDTNLTFEQKGWTLVIEDKNNVSVKEYVYEIWDYKWKKKIREVSSEREVTNIPLNFYGKTILKVKAITKDGVEYRSVALVLTFDEEHKNFILEREHVDVFNLPRISNTMELIDFNRMKYTLLNNYAWDFTIRWFMYKNGGCIWSATSANTSIMEFEFAEPGEYCMMYYLESGDKEKQFYCFPEYVY